MLADYYLPSFGHSAAFPAGSGRAAETSEHEHSRPIDTSTRVNTHAVQTYALCQVNNHMGKVAVMIGHAEVCTRREEAMLLIAC